MFLRPIVWGAFAFALPFHSMAVIAADTSGCQHPLSTCLAETAPLNVPSGIVISPPLVVTPTAGGGLAANMSLSSWRDYNSSRTTEMIEASGLDPSTPRPKAARPKFPTELWTRVELPDPLGTASHGVRYEAGVDTKLGSRGTIGVSSAIAEQANGSSDPLLETVGARAFFVVLPTLSIEAKGRWNTQDEGEPAADKPDVESSAMTITPRLSQRIALSDGTSIEPFITLQSDVAPYAATDGLNASAGSGFTLNSLNSYSLSVSATVDDITAPEQAPINGKLQLKIPLR